jgi:peptidoglycan/xylan/chitin deacetylase (PgdA/CDA1 family)
MLTLDRNSLASALDGLRVPAMTLALRRVAPRCVTVLTYHRVGRPEAAARLDDGVVDVTPEQLDRQLAFVRRWFDLIAIDDLLSWVSGRGKLPRKPLLVTFDDGYRDNHDVALPILQRHGVRATFFVATSYVESRRLFWWDRIARAMKVSPRRRIAVEYPERVELALGSDDAKRASIRRALRIVKDRSGLDLERFVGGLERAAGATLGAAEERRIADAVVMRWEHVAALRRAGMDVQSHTCSHRVLQTLGPAELRHELRASRAALERALGERVRAVSYPVGASVAASSAIKRIVREEGYELGFSNGTGVNRAATLDPLDVKRISLDIRLSDAFFRAMLAIPWLAY